MFRNLKLRWLAAATVTSVSLAMSASAFAQTTFPSRTARIIVPFAPGGAVDFVGRLVAERLTAALGQQFIVENRPGAFGTIGSELVAKAAPDGYTLLVQASVHVINAALLPKLPYDTWNDFTPISRVSEGPVVLIVNNAVPARNAKELVALIKARPGQINTGTESIGSAGHLAMELFRNATGTRFEIINYKGAGPAMIDIQGGHIAGMFSTMIAARPQILAGKVRALGVAAARRSAALPDVPTMIEQGFPNFEMYSWHGVYGPANLPKDVLGILSAAIMKFMGQPEARERLLTQGFEPIVSTPQQFIEFQKKEFALYERLIREGKIRIE
jgi:tripartite-type tricarboxylate transporter receptor subunit TctC